MLRQRRLAKIELPLSRFASGHGPSRWAAASVIHSIETLTSEGAKGLRARQELRQIDYALFHDGEHRASYEVTARTVKFSAHPLRVASIISTLMAAYLRR